MRNWKTPNATAKSRLQVTMEAANSTSQPQAVSNIFDLFYQKDSRTLSWLRVSCDRVTVWNLLYNPT